MKFLESSCRHPNVQAELRTSGLRERNHAVGKECACVLSCFSRVRLCNSVDCSPPGSPVHGISQARILKWVASSFSRGSSRFRDRTRVSCITGGFFTTEPPGKPPQSNKLGQSFVSFTTRITVLCCLMSRLLTTSVSYISSIFFFPFLLVVSGRKVNTVSATLPWLGAEFCCLLKT